MFANCCVYVYLRFDHCPYEICDFNEEIFVDPVCKIGNFASEVLFVDVCECGSC